MLTRLRLGGTIKALIVVFWLVMVYFLVERVHMIPDMIDVESTRLAETQSWMSIYFKGQKVGYTYQALTPIQSGYALDQKTFMRLNLMGQVQELRTLTSALLNKALGLTSFNFFMSAGPIRYQLGGTLNGLTLELAGMTGAYRNKMSLRLESVPRLASGLMHYLVQKGLEKGQRFRVPIFDPSTLSTRQVQVVVEDSEKLVIDGQPVDTFRVRMDYADIQTYAWVDTQGRTIKETGLLGMTLERTTESKATEGIAGRAELSDLVASTSAPTNRVLEAPRQVRYLKARLKGLDFSGFELDGGRQRFKDGVVEVTRQPIDFKNEKHLPLRDPNLQPDLEPTPFIQSRHPKVIRQARVLVAGLTSPLEIIDRIVGWVYEELDKRPTMSVPSALDVLETKVGDCNEHAVLAAGLLRAAGVPTRMAVGVLYFEGRFYYHAWLEAYWGRWMAVDPLLGQIPADATHIRFLTGDLSRQTDMVRVIGRLEVEILDVK
ncbi:MAG: transglutaminase-like domain-containing protein [Proteobacteria bacterium]|nr:transglutaminase-like domain-containing protein [Pseudomonadota bacterium]